MLKTTWFVTTTLTRHRHSLLNSYSALLSGLDRHQRLKRSAFSSTSIVCGGGEMAEHNVLKRTLPDDETLDPVTPGTAQPKRLKPMSGFPSSEVSDHSLPMDPNAPQSLAMDVDAPSDQPNTTEDQQLVGGGVSGTARKNDSNAVAGKSEKKKEKEAKKSGRRSRRGTRNDEGAGAEESPDHPKTPRLPKRQCALLIGFCGSGYSGMQMYPTFTSSTCFLAKSCVQSTGSRNDYRRRPFPSHGPSRCCLSG